MTDQEAFLDERRRARRFFNRMSPLYPIVERHLFPQYRDVLARLALPPELSVLDLATPVPVFWPAPSRSAGMQ
jgi:hypothetical protein